NRLILARLFSKPANLLVLDEPTNDLDLETLELLEELLLEFQGTLLLVSHDRAFVDNVVQSCIIFEGQGTVQRYVGGYADWVRQGGQFRADTTTAAPPKSAASRAEAPASEGAKPAAAPARKLSYKLQRGLAQTPAAIEAAGRPLAELAHQTRAPGVARAPQE